MIFGEQMRDDVVLRLLDGQSSLETSKFLDRLMELSTLEEAEHQSVSYTHLTLPTSVTV